jgi:predicted RNase H-like HicB family nuclease
MSKQDYTIIYEQSPTGSWGAYVKGLSSSCVATGQTREECDRRIQEAIPLQLEALAPAGRAGSTRRRSVRTTPAHRHPMRR